MNAIYYRWVYRINFTGGGVMPSIHEIGVNPQPDIKCKEGQFIYFECVCGGRGGREGGTSFLVQYEIYLD